MLRGRFAGWTHLIRSKFRRARPVGLIRREINRKGWDEYSKGWGLMKADGQIPDLDPTSHPTVRFLGDEWSLMEGTEFPYGIGVHSLSEFRSYIDANLFSPYLPTGNELDLMELGPGGGRITALLLPRCRNLYAVDISSEMLSRLKMRFQGEPKLAFILTDGTDIQGIPASTVDAFVSFDTFVHLEPWEIFRYLEVVKSLLKPRGVGIVHFSDVETPIGFNLFRSQVGASLKIGSQAGHFSVMNKNIMRKFLDELGFDVAVISNEIFPRDAIAVFQRGR